MSGRADTALLDFIESEGGTIARIREQTHYTADQSRLKRMLEPFVLAQAEGRKVQLEIRAEEADEVSDLAFDVTRGVPRSAKLKGLVLAMSGTLQVGDPVDETLVIDARVEVLATQANWRAES